MFREYLRRLEKHKRCQHLSMQSFLLLPMQRITRLPLLILAILNKTPHDHEDHGLVEKSLRTVQKVTVHVHVYMLYMLYMYMHMKKHCHMMGLDKPVIPGQRLFLAS